MISFCITPNSSLIFLAPSPNRKKITLVAKKNNHYLFVHGSLIWTGLSRDSLCSTGYSPQAGRLTAKVAHSHGWQGGPCWGWELGCWPDPQFSSIYPFLVVRLGFSSPGCWVLRGRVPRMNDLKGHTPLYKLLLATCLLMSLWPKLAP